MSDGGAPVVAIVGGGFTGAAIAWHLGRGRQRPAVTVFEPRPVLGAGLAYDTADPVHRINVPAARMSLLPGDEAHFARWLDATGLADRDAERPDGSLYPRRAVFGRYVAAHLAPLLRSGAVAHIGERVTSVEAGRGGWRLTGDGGTVLRADIVVVATSHPPPAAPAGLGAALAAHPRFIADPTVPGALDPVGPDDRVLVIGNGLTAADVVASLAARGHRGRVLSVSRRGLRSRGHPAVRPEPFGNFVDPPARSARSLLRRVRAEVRRAAAAGIGWHAVIDAVRGEGGKIWTALPAAERRRLVRHLRPFWDVHRFRVAPQVEAVLDAAIAAGRLEIAAASIEAARPAGAEIEVVLRRRGAPAPETRRFDAVVVTTGPSHRGILAAQPYLAGLAEAGFVRLDDAGLGLACDGHGRAIGARGASGTLFIAGPLARGTFGELMGLPQVADYAAFIAAEVEASLALSPAPAV